MKIEIMLPSHNHSFSRNDIEFERLFNQKILPKVECFLSFLETHEIIDTEKHKFIKNIGILGHAYAKGETEPFQFLIAKN